MGIAPSHGITRAHPPRRNHSSSSSRSSSRRGRQRNKAPRGFAWVQRGEAWMEGRGSLSGSWRWSRRSGGWGWKVSPRDEREKGPRVCVCDGDDARGGCGFYCRCRVLLLKCFFSGPRVSGVSVGMCVPWFDPAVEGARARVSLTPVRPEAACSVDVPGEWACPGPPLIDLWRRGPPTRPAEIGVERTPARARTSHTAPSWRGFASQAPMKPRARRVTPQGPPYRPGSSRKPIGQTMP